MLTIYIIINMLRFKMTTKYTKEFQAKPTRDAFRTIDRKRGALIGLAVGDAVGTTLEFTARGGHNLTDMVGGGPFRLNAGEWTDDTSMALCLAESLMAHGFDPVHQMHLYCQWRNKGHNASNGRCFDIGGTVAGALNRFTETGIGYSGSTNYDTAGNGSIMRLSPVAIRYASEPAKAVWLAGESSKTTHGSKQCVDSCMYFAGLLVMAMRGERKGAILSELKSPMGIWPDEFLCKEVDAVARGSFKTKTEDTIRGSGYVIHSLEAALWAFHTTRNFRDCILRAANIGEDADSTAAVAGQLAGAYYGESGIPIEWRNKLAKKNLIDTLTAGLIAKE